MGFVRDITGVSDQRDAQRDANRIQQEAGRESLELQERLANRSMDLQEQALADLRGDLAPFRELGQKGIGLTSFLTDPQEQSNFVKTNPLFQAALESVNEATMQNRAARGKLGSGGTLEALQGNYLTSALPFIDRQTQNINNLLSVGQNAAARSGNAGLQSASAQGNILGNLSANQASTMQQMGNVGAATALNRGQLMGQSQNDLFGMFMQGGQGALMGSGLLGGGALGGGSALSGAGLGALVGLCDERLKENKVKLYVDDDGLTVYEFTYKGDSQKYQGKMAQDIQKIDPDAVSENDEGYLMVTEKYAPKPVQEAS